MLASLLSTMLTQRGYSVRAIDADPNDILVGALGFPHPENITPISEMGDLIQERIGARPGQEAMQDIAVHLSTVKLGGVGKATSQE